MKGIRNEIEVVLSLWVGSPMYQQYAVVAPHPEDWPELIGRVGTLLRQDYDWSAQTAALKSPALIVAGDSDAVNPAHAVEFFNLLGGDHLRLPRRPIGLKNLTTETPRHREKLKEAYYGFLGVSVPRCLAPMLRGALFH